MTDFPDNPIDPSSNAAQNPIFNSGSNDMPPPNAGANAGQPAYAPPPNGQPQQMGQMPYGQVPKKKKKWPWIVGGIILVLILLVGGCTYLVSKAIGPVLTTELYFLDVETDNYEGAHGRLCEELRNELTPADVEAFFTANPVQDHNTLDFSETTPGRSRIVVEVTQNGTVQVRQLTAVNEDGWKVCPSANALAGTN